MGEFVEAYEPVQCTTRQIQSTMKQRLESKGTMHGPERAVDVDLSRLLG
jgi:hypothetical protein